MSHPLQPDPYGLSSLAQGWDGFWKRLVTPESLDAWDSYFGRLNVNEPFDWQIVGLWDMGRRVRLIQFNCPIPGAREASGRVVDAGEAVMTRELQRLEFQALLRQHTPTNKRP